MHIEFVDIQNFRRLHSCRIDLASTETLFVGANNSGKTSAMDALIAFFKSRILTTKDFTLSNWSLINDIGASWEKEPDLEKLDLTVGPWQVLLPTLDVWLHVEPSEIHYVSHLIPTLDWSGGSLGVRVRYEPKDIPELRRAYLSENVNSRSLQSTAKGKETKFKLWPKDMWDYLDRDKMLATHFVFRTFLLDPAQKASPQILPTDTIALDESAFNGLIKVDIINAQRGFSDVNSETGETSRVRNLSNQLRSYYDKHLNPTLKPTTHDLEAIRAIEDAKELFDKNLQESFKASLGELEGLNYPGFSNPKITLSSRLNAVDTLNHETSVRYNLSDELELSLPEKYNGLGYQNLISMIFKLIRFRDEWMQVGKSARAISGEGDDLSFEPLQLVLIEEPEAHLHAQVQQVFIKEAYKVLRNHPRLKDSKNFSTQLVISTHSNHIAHEIDFTSLRYFKRVGAGKGAVATSKVVNLSKTFGTEDATTKFAIRYLRTTHCDLFFADAVILVEGPAERMLVPFFIRHHSKLNVCYISILEIGGSHAHTLKPLVESLGIITLIITDLDAANPKANNGKAQPALGEGYVTGNDTLRNWLPVNSKLDELLSFGGVEKVHPNFPIRVAYQTAIEIEESEKKRVIVYPYTFEDCVVMENRPLFQKMPKATGLLQKMIEGAKDPDVLSSAKKLYDTITESGARKAEFALELLYLQEPEKLSVPTYIKEGLTWLEEKLLPGKQNLVTLKRETK